MSSIKAALRQAALREGEFNGINNSNNYGGTDDSHILDAINRRRSKNLAGGASPNAAAATFFGEDMSNSNSMVSGGDGEVLIPDRQTRDENSDIYPEAIQVSGADLASRGAVHLDGVYLREWNIQGAPHFKRRSKVYMSNLC